ncbi:MAG TPA: hypothetical protein VI032_03480 [Burkholderiaceae bacterium]
MGTAGSGPSFGALIRFALALALVASIQGCAAPRGDDVPVIEHKLNSSVGKRFDATDWSKSTGAVTRTLPDSNGNREIEYLWKNGCSFVVSIDRSSQAIVSWRYSSKPELCQTIRSYTFGT